MTTKSFRHVVKERVFIPTSGPTLYLFIFIPRPYGINFKYFTTTVKYAIPGLVLFANVHLNNRVFASSTAKSRCDILVLFLAKIKIKIILNLKKYSFFLFFVSLLVFNSVIFKSNDGVQLLTKQIYCSCGTIIL